MEGVMLKLIYVGRLVKEKGFDLVLDFCHRLAKDEKLSKIVALDIFGDGELKEKIPSYPFLTYHGHLPKEQVLEHRKDAHFTLLPSQFLETFGLTALDSLSVGVPVIAYPKGALLQFLTAETSVSSGQRFDSFLIDFLHSFTNFGHEFDTQKWQKLSQWAVDCYQAYTCDKRLERFKSFSGMSSGTILLVSDYIVDIGGIESYLLQVKSFLEEQGYTVHLAGCSKPRNAMQRFRSLWSTLFNIGQAKKIKELVMEYKPDLIWRHSIHRYLGRLPVWSMRNYTGKQWVMYHDFGLFHPYPSKVYDEQQLYYPHSLGQFLLAAKRSPGMKKWKRLASIPLLIIKRWMICVLQKLLYKQVNLHLVPSSYIERVVHRRYGKRDLKVKTMPHFA